VLIVNADDFGASRSATKAILEAFDAGAISSASAMVWMPDTERAAELAQQRGLPLGLHLNLTLPLPGPGAPPAVAYRQMRMTESFGKESWWRGEVRGIDAAELEAAVSDQLHEFRSHFGEPTHINGHHHVHVTDAVLNALPASVPIRQVPTTPGRILDRDKRVNDIQRRFRAPWATLDIVSLHPNLGGVGFAALVEFRHQAIEVVTHPQQPDQREALLGSIWLDAVASLGLSSFDAL
jgi:predicted glycoside hydrolase/deacetylase ChbG (UPF0249 family)